MSQLTKNSFEESIENDITNTSTFRYIISDISKSGICEGFKGGEGFKGAAELIANGRAL